MKYCMMNKINSEKKWKSISGLMFREDFVTHLCISLLDLKSNNSSIFQIESNDNKLKQMITSNDKSYLKYNLSQIITNIVDDMIIKGKAFLHVIYYLDDSNRVSGFDFKKISYRYHFKGIKKTIFYFRTSHNNNLKNNNIKIYNKDLIEFKISDIGLRVSDFNKIEKSLSQLGLDKLPIQKLKELNLDIENYTKQEKLYLYKSTKRIPWNGRYNGNDYITEPYQLYRLANFKIMQLKFLKYIVDKINGKINEIGKEYEFEGKIIYNTIGIEDIKDIIIKIDSGEIQFEEAIDYLLCNKDYTKK
ncbi:Uncharacterised protein [[Clostridium] sordellii]|nr:Uncharacterised protein [[Clostridium] sordellii] [Paeniclostridium sordellii]